MYHLSDRKSAIKEIQKYLFVISDRIYPDIARIPIDGVYDGETANAVKHYQRLKGLEVTGTVNYESFTAMYNDYDSVIRESKMRDFIVGKTEFPLKVGTYSEDVRALHIILNELAESFSEIENVGTGAYYSERTARAVRAFTEIFGYPPSDTVDKKLFSRFDTELKAIRAGNKKYS